MLQGCKEDLLLCSNVIRSKQRGKVVPWWDDGKIWMIVGLVVGASIGQCRCDGRKNGRSHMTCQIVHE